MENKLDKARKIINEVDSQMAELFVKRMRAAEMVYEHKKEFGLPILDQARENAVIEKNRYEVPAIFKMMAREGQVEEDMMYNTYNMGIGMMVCVDPADVDKAMEAMRSAGDTPYVIGKIIDGEKGVTLC